MARGDVTEYGNQLWAKNRGRIEYYDEVAETWLRWDPGKHDTMAPPAFFENSEDRVFRKLAAPSAIRMAFRTFLVGVAIWVPIAVAFIFVYSSEGFSSGWFTWLNTGQIVATALYEVALGALLATVALGFATVLGNRPLFGGDDDASE